MEPVGLNRSVSTDKPAPSPSIRTEIPNWDDDLQLDSDSGESSVSAMETVKIVCSFAHSSI